MNIFDDIKLQYKIGGMVQKLIFWNIGLFVLFSLLTVVFKFSNIAFNYFDWVALSSNTTEFLAKPWTIVTFNFFHATILHLIFNLIVLHFSGRLFNTYFTDKQLFGVYLLGGIFSGLTFILMFFLLGKTSPLVGASGAIMALLIATATYAPFMLLRIPLLGVVKLWHVASVILLRLATHLAWNIEPNLSLVLLSKFKTPSISKKITLYFIIIYSYFKTHLSC